MLLLLALASPTTMVAASSPTSIANTNWRVTLNVGRQPGTWMPKDWAASGARLSRRWMFGSQMKRSLDNDERNLPANPIASHFLSFVTVDSAHRLVDMLPSDLLGVAINGVVHGLWLGEPLQNGKGGLRWRISA